MDWKATERQELMETSVAMESPGKVERRRFLLSGGLAAAVVAAACNPETQAPKPAAAPPGTVGWENEWQDLVAAATKEGKLVVITGLGASLRENALEFEKAFPGIAVEHSGANATQFGPKVVLERKAGVYGYDVLITTLGFLPITRPEGVIEPVRPLIFRPDVLGDRYWRDGFEAGFLDTDKQWAYSSFFNLGTRVWINTDLVREGEIATAQDLLNPKWRGKIIAGDPRVSGAAYWPATVMRLAFGDDVIKRFFGDQEVVVGRDIRQMTEFMVKGRYAIAFGAITENFLDEFAAEGLGKNLKHVEIEHVTDVLAGPNVVFYLNRAPHPNASKLFVNWLLTKEAQTIWAKGANTNSRRTDVPPAHPRLVPNPAKRYVQIDREEMIPEWDKTRELARAALDQ